MQPNDGDVWLDASLRDRWVREGSTWTIEIPTGWMQGRSVFGGLTTAVAAALGRRIVTDEQRSVRTLSVQLLAPVRPGSLTGVARVLREGRNVTFCEVRLSQAGRETAIANLVFAKALASTLVAPNALAPPTPDPESLRDLPYVAGLLPEFTQHVQMRWASGGLPFSRSDTARFTGLFRYRVPLGDAEGLIALLDTWPCPSLSLLSEPSPASTVSWTAHLLSLPPRNDGWFTMAYETVAGAHGFHTAVGHLYADDGTLLGWTEQLVAVFG